MISLQRIFFTIAFLATISNARAQYITIDESQTVTQLVEDVLINNACANVSNITVTSYNGGGGDSYGYFTAGTSAFPFVEGIVLTTGRAVSAIGPNSGILSEGPTSWAGDSDLEQALGVNNTINATVLEFDFLPLANKISFDYLFASEQYLTNPSSGQCNYTDGFAFLLKKANTSDPYQNLALVPGTNIPVRVNTVRGAGTICPAANEAYFDSFNDFENPTNYNGQTVILTAASTVEPNVLYHIKLVIADQGNNLYDSAIFLGGGSFKVQKDLGDNRLFATNNPLCPNETLVLDATEPGINTYQWFKNGVAIPAETNPTYTVISAGIYEVEISLNSAACISTGEITIEYATLPTITTPVSLVECDGNSDGSTTFNLNDASSLISSTGTFAYFTSLANAQNNVSAIANISTFSASNNTTVFAAVSNSYGCRDFATVQLQISSQAIPPIAPINVCDNDGSSDGITASDLNALVTPTVISGLPIGVSVLYFASIAEAESEANQLPNSFTNTQPNQQIIYARIVNAPDCFGIVPITLKINSFNASGIADETLYICSNTPIVLQAPAGFSQYLWNNGESTRNITVSAGGNYSVTITNSNGCSATKLFTVNESSEATYISADINDFQSDGNLVLINYSGLGNYVFSLDGTRFQSSPLFDDVTPGEYQIFIRDEFGCGIVGPFTIYVLDYPHFFTPNGDGFNDFWGINIPANREFSTLQIFDRFGKILFSTADSSARWDGKFNGHALTSTDYWFVLNFRNGRTVKGHFSLKR